MLIWGKDRRHCGGVSRNQMFRFEVHAQAFGRCYALVWMFVQYVRCLSSGELELNALIHLNDAILLKLCKGGTFSWDEKVAAASVPHIHSLQ